MIKKIKLTNCAEGPWKNGLGKTRQIAIFPHEATLAAGNFDWRLSSATILGDNSFSQFNGLDRLLIVWKGEGLLLNGEELLAHTPLHFQGEEKIECSLIDHEVIDLGLIYDRNKMKAELDVLSGRNAIDSQDKTVFLFIARGQGRAFNHNLNEGEFLIVENTKIEIQLDENALAYRFLIQHL